MTFFTASQLAGRPVTISAAAGSAHLASIQLADTGQDISNCTRAVITLDAMTGELSAVLTLVESFEAGQSIETADATVPVASLEAHAYVLDLSQPISTQITAQDEAKQPDETEPEIDLATLINTKLTDVTQVDAA